MYDVTIRYLGKEITYKAIVLYYNDASGNKVRCSMRPRQINSRNPEDIKYGPLKIFAGWSFLNWLIPGFESIIELKPGVEIQLSAPLEEKKEDKANREPNVISFTDATFSEPIEIEFNPDSEVKR